MKHQLSTLPLELVEFDHMPDSANVRLPTVMKLFGMSAATVWRHAGKLIPAPIKLTPRVTVWNVGELKKSLAAKTGVPPAPSKVLTKTVEGVEGFS